jgi:hypothetical protein
LDVVGLPAGTYTVDTNGVTETFTLTQDNSLQNPDEDAGGSKNGGNSGGEGSVPGNGGNIQGGLANVTDVQVMPESAPPSASIVIRGWLSTPCVEITRITDQYSGSAITVTVATEEPTDLACIQVIEEFEEYHTLRNIPGRGTYTLVVNGFVSQFTIP